MEETLELPVVEATDGEDEATTVMATPTPDVEDPPAVVTTGEKEKAPKRAMSAFHFFAAERRAGVKVETPGITSSEIQKKLTEMWRASLEDDREPYQKLAIEDKIRYDRDAVGWHVAPKPTKSGKRLAKDSEAPKKAKTAYLFFADDKRPDLSREFPGLGVGGLAKHLAEAWKACSAEEKKVLHPVIPLTSLKRASQPSLLPSGLSSPRHSITHTQSC